MINFQKHQLKNGLRVLTAPMKETNAVTILFLFHTGSRFETKEQNGTAHFLEHLMFKGTKKRSDAQAISYELDNMGAVYNAFTGEEVTGYYVCAPFDLFSKAFDVLFDMVFHSQIAPREIEKEKGVIIEEINMYQDIPQRHVVDLAKELIFLNHPVGFNIAGTKETVKSFKQSDFLSFRQQFYHPSNLILAVTGQEGRIRWIDLIKKYCNGLEKRNKILEEIFLPRQERPAMRVYSKKTDQAHFVLGVHSFSRLDKRRPALRVLNNILGDTMSSRLFFEVRGKRGLAYHISSDYWDFQDHGVFVVQAGIKINKIEEALKVTLNELAKLKKEKVREEELKKAQENLKGRLYLGLEDSHSIADFLAEQEIFWGRIEQPEEIVAANNKVDALDIQKLANDIFQNSKLNLAIIGPYKNEEKFVRLLDV